VGIQVDIPWNGGRLSCAKSLKEKCVSAKVKLMVGNIEDLRDIWHTRYILRSISRRCYNIL
jgi:hypothetical protein